MHILLKFRPWFERNSSLYWIAALAAILVLPSLFVGYATDDHFFRMVNHGSPGLPELDHSPFNTFRFFDDDPASRAARMERGLLPWWAYEGGRLAFMRPLTSLSYWIDFKLFGDHPMPMHAHSILLFVLLVAAVGLLYRRLEIMPWLAGLAALLYAVDDARSLPVGWLSNRNAILATLFGVLALIAHDRWRRDGWRIGPVVATACFGLGLLAGEAGIAAGAYLFAYALLIDKAPLVRRVATLVPYGVVTVAWRLAYRYFGFGAYGSAGYVDPIAEPGLFLQNAAKHLPLLLSGQFGMPDSSVWVFMPQQGALVYLAVAVLFVGLVAILLAPIIRRDRLAQFWALGMLLSLVPSCATVPQDRLLTFAGIGGMALLARFFHAAAISRDQLPSWRIGRRVALVAAPVLLFVHLALSPLLLAHGSYMIAYLEDANLRAGNSAPMDPAIQEDSLVLVNVPSDLMGIGLPILRSSMGQPVPKHTWQLSAGMTPVHIARPDERTLIVMPEGGFLTKPWAEMFRHAERFPMRAGQEIKLSGMRVDILQASEDGRPTMVQYTFEKPLEDDSLRWYYWKNGIYVPYTLPAVGKTNTIGGMEFRELLKVAMGFGKSNPEELSKSASVL
ncbi:MAG: hypothetical protein IT368_17990 [Candidatus Hydrogenedentes bacterium]|nr:hypothetical protein [Candidatus Hydrogenedentota bacterium]